MADARSRRTGEHNAQIIKLMTDAVSMREQIAALEARIQRLEAMQSTGGPPRPPSRRPPVGPPPLPKMTPSMPALPKSVGRRSIVDISEIAELVDSSPPPPVRPRK